MRSNGVNRCLENHGFLAMLVPITQVAMSALIALIARAHIVFSLLYSNMTSKQPILV